MNELLAMRPVNYAGIDELLWIKQDRGAFSGPLMDLRESSHLFIEKVKNRNVVIQAGGNCGLYARFYGALFKTVYTFEPDPLNFECLDFNCQGDTYKKFFGALGNDSSQRLTLRRSHMSNCGMHKMTNQPGDVVMYTIDELNLTECDLIHLDIEDYEVYALQGAVKTIEQHKPVIIVEHGGNSNAPSKQYIESLGYVLWRRERMDSIFIPKE